MSTPYASAAPYYARYRPPYPAELYALLTERFALDGSQTVLDLGAGPGTVSLRLAALVEQVYAVDPEPAMLAEGCRLAEEQGRTNIAWLRGDSAGIGRLCLPRIDLCVIGGAFHRMDPTRLPAELDSVLAPRGGIAVVTTLAGAAAGQQGRGPAWPAVVDEVCARFLGSAPRTGHGPSTHPAGGAEEAEQGDELQGLEGLEGLQELEDRLAKSAFSHVRTTTWERSTRCTVDELVGLQLSRPRSSPARLGDRKGAFESELRRALLAHDPGGTYTRTVTVAATIATRPRR
ncbi:class I SAM-dependent methyltransferase [Streptomyces sp. NBC_01232]|uniref:class I SAM-dependent methyltransferase n=1 Tax=Streptomyces sp. NBC_01232 TaxID=2903786 RepID=UPI002E11CCAC|nr:class I SAM-dependent methyltransferase [Streptomyces sp. NBC_01232]